MKNGSGNTPTLTSTGDRVREILEATDRAAEAVLQASKTEAKEYAEEVRARADRVAREYAEEAKARAEREAQARAARVRELSDALLGRIGEISRQAGLLGQGIAQANTELMAELERLGMGEEVADPSGNGTASSVDPLPPQESADGGQEAVASNDLAGEEQDGAARKRGARRRRGGQ